MAAGFGHSMILAHDDTVLATGWNLYGQFGDGSITSTSTFTRVVVMSDALVEEGITFTENWLPLAFAIPSKGSLTGEKYAAACLVCSYMFLQSLDCITLVVL